MKKIQYSLFWYGLTLMLFGGYLNMFIFGWILDNKPSLPGIMVVIWFFVLSTLQRHQLINSINKQLENQSEITSPPISRPEELVDICPPHTWTTAEESSEMFCKLCGRRAGKP